MVIQLEQHSMGLILGAHGAFEGVRDDHGGEGHGVQLGGPGGPAGKVGWKHRARAAVDVCLERMHRVGVGLVNRKVQRPRGTLL